ncbi:cyclic-di-AMP receptor [Clostridium oceanicum]|uniref:Cyclic-di-AMP receptor n=1 Tax=Clostridium oceanicum TaxID=1543 RepID=A0ABP3UWK0_9CLOT
MKLVIAIVQDDDVSDLIDDLTESGYRITKLATTGGFLKVGNTTLMIGVEEKEVDKVISKIEDICKTRKQVISSASPMNSSTGMYIPYPMEVNVGGATIFVVDVDKFVRV